MRTLRPLLLLLAAAALPLLSAASIKVVTPEAKANLTLGLDAPVTWTYAGLPDGTPVKVVLFRNGAKLGIIAQNVPIRYALSPSGTGALPDKWKVGSYAGGSAPQGCQYSIRVRTMDNAVEGESGAFCIVTPAPAGVFGLISPAGGESWPLGSKQKIAWTCSGYDNLLRVILFRGTQQLGIIAKPSAASGHCKWTVGELMPPYHNVPVPAGNDYHIRIESLSGELTDRNQTPFSVVASGLTPALQAGLNPRAAEALAPKWVKIVSPTAGDTFKRLEQYKLIWQYSDFLKGREASLWLLKGGQPYKPLIEKCHLLGDRNFFQVQTEVPEGDYTLRLQATGYSDAKSDVGPVHVVGVEKALTLTFAAQTDNKFKYHRHNQQGVLDVYARTGSAFFKGEYADPGSGLARVGYTHECEGSSYVNYIYRSYVRFDIKGVTGTVKSARITFFESSPPATLVQWWVLDAPWDGQGDSLFSPAGHPLNLNNADQLRDLVSGWIADPAKNYGLVVTGDNESLSVCDTVTAVHILKSIVLEVAETVVQ